MSSKDQMIFSHMVEYCDQVRQAIDLFGEDEALFLQNQVYQNACCMCLLQIGELAGRLSPEALAETTDIPWRQIRALRNICAHSYGSLSLSSIWVTLTEEVPDLKKRCEKFLFDISPEKPNRETTAAMLEAERPARDPNAKRYHSVKELFTDLEKDDE